MSVCVYIPEKKLKVKKALVKSNYNEKQYTYEEFLFIKAPKCML